MGVWGLGFGGLNETAGTFRVWTSLSLRFICSFFLKHFCSSFCPFVVMGKKKNKSAAAAQQQQAQQAHQAQQQQQQPPLQAPVSVSDDAEKEHPPSSEVSVEPLTEAHAQVGPADADADAASVPTPPPLEARDENASLPRASSSSSLDASGLSTPAPVIATSASASGGSANDSNGDAEKEALVARVAELEAKLKASQDELASVRAKMVEEAQARASAASTEAESLSRRAEEAREVFEMKRTDMDALKQRLKATQSDRASAEGARDAAWLKLSGAVQNLVQALQAGHPTGAPANPDDDKSGWSEEDW